MGLGPVWRWAGMSRRWNRGLTTGGTPAACVLFYVVLTVSVPCYGKYSGGLGDPNDPFQIWDANDLNEIGLHEEDWDKHFVMMSDVDMSGFDGLEGRPAFNPIGYYVDDQNKLPFSGVFDGNGKKVFNFYLSSEVNESVGLFAYADGSEFVIKDIGLINPVVIAKNSSYVGSLIGRFYQGEVSSCYAQGGKVEGGPKYVGGLVGSGNGEIYRCYSTCEVFGSESVGGLIGGGGGSVNECFAGGKVEGVKDVGGLVGRGGQMNRCYSTCDVYGSENVGGLIGNTYQSINECFAGGNVTGNTNVGGFAGRAVGTPYIINCYATGDVTGQNVVGGFVGVFSAVEGVNTYLQKCYASGLVTGDNETGGIAGSVWSTDQEDCYWDTETTGQFWGAGSVRGKTEHAAGLYGRVTAEMYSAETYRGWSYCGVMWSIDEGKDYPRFLWQEMPGTVIDHDFSGGQGTENDPYLLKTAEDIVCVGYTPCLLDKHFRLVGDIDMAGIDPNELRSTGWYRWFGWGIEYIFTGVFDGDGHVISNLVMPEGGGGLFGWIGGGGTIKNLGLLNVLSVNPSMLNQGALVRTVKRGGIVENCWVEDGVVEGENRVGGLVGRNEGTIIRCRFDGQVSGNIAVGGLVGYNFTGDRVIDCYASGSVSSETSCAGGLVGENGGLIVNCYSVGEVSSGDELAGGLVGASGGPAHFSYWDVESSGLDISAAGEGRTTLEMQMASTFTDAGWDFVGEDVNGGVDIWRMCLDGVGYPRLSWEYGSIGDFACGDGVGFEDVVYLCERWLMEDEFAGAADGDGDGVVDFGDFGILVEHWVEE